MWWLVSADGPLPIGDIIYIFVALVLCIPTVIDIINYEEDICAYFLELFQSLYLSRPLDENGKPVVEPGEEPTSEEGYEPPKSGSKKVKVDGGNKTGWLDKNGNIWIPVPTGSSGAHGGGHWDVQGKRGGYTNVYPGGATRGGMKPFPRLAPLVEKI